MSLFRSSSFLGLLSKPPPRFYNHSVTWAGPFLSSFARNRKFSSSTSPEELLFVEENNVDPEVKKKISLVSRKVRAISRSKTDYSKELLEGMWEEIKSKNVPLDSELVSHILFASSKLGSKEIGLRMVEFAKEKDIKTHHVMMNSLGVLGNFRPESVEEYWKEYLQYHTPILSSFHAILTPFAKERNVEKVKKYLDQMKESKVQFKERTYGILIDAYAGLPEAEQWYEEMLSKGLKPYDSTMETLLEHFTIRNEYEKVVKLCRKLLDQNQTPNRKIVDAYISALLRIGDEDQIIHFVQGLPKFQTLPSPAVGAEMSKVLKSRQKAEMLWAFIRGYYRFREPLSFSLEDAVEIVEFLTRRLKLINLRCEKMFEWFATQHTTGWTCSLALRVLNAIDVRHVSEFQLTNRKQLLSKIKDQDQDKLLSGSEAKIFLDLLKSLTPALDTHEWQFQ